MSSANGSDPDFQIRATPEPEPEELAAIVAALCAKRRVVEAASAEEPSRPSSRWARAGRREAMDARNLERYVDS